MRKSGTSENEAEGSGERPKRLREAGFSEKKARASQRGKSRIPQGAINELHSHNISKNVSLEIQMVYRDIPGTNLLLGIFRLLVFRHIRFMLNKTVLELDEANFLSINQVNSGDSSGSRSKHLWGYPRWKQTLPLLTLSLC